MRAAAGRLSTPRARGRRARALDFLASGTLVTVVTNDHHANRSFPEAPRSAAHSLDATEHLRLQALSGLTTG